LNFFAACRQNTGENNMEKEIQEIKMSCPVCGFIMSGIIEKIPKSFVCPSCNNKFSIVAQVSTK